MDTCRRRIFKGVEKFEKLGTPGKILVFGDVALPLVTAKNEEEVVMAASMLCKGRIVAFSHNFYGHEMIDCQDEERKHLYDNICAWAANKEGEIHMLVVKDIDHLIKKPEDMNAYDILINIGPETAKSEVIEKFVKRGGGFIQAITNWNYFEGGKSICDIPYFNILYSAGILYLNGYIMDDIHISNSAVARQNFTFKEVVQIDSKSSTKKCISLQPQIWEDIKEEVKGLCQSDQVSSKDSHEKHILDYWVDMVQLNESKLFKAPCIKIFPGDYDKPPQFKCKSICFKSTLEDFHFTACHLPAGNVAKFKVTNIEGSWRLFVGAHLDSLDTDVCNRWPNIYREHLVDQVKTYELSTPFGGSIILRSPNNDAHIDATIDGVVLCPRYDINDPNVWRHSKCEPGIWAELSGKHITFTFPSSSVRGIKDPKEVIELWDRLLEAFYDLIGKDILEHRKIWVVSDIQPKEGYMHPGYPIVTHLDVTEPNNEGFLLNKDNFLNGNFWLLFHEIGYNLLNPMWTFNGTDQVTCNIFILYGMIKLCKIPPSMHPLMQPHLEKAKEYILKGPKFKESNVDTGIHLYMYIQLNNHFGWETYKKVFRSYNNLREDQKPKENHDKIDMWFVTFSDTVQENLTPFADLWGIPLSETAKHKMEKYPCSVPEVAELFEK